MGKKEVTKQALDMPLRDGVRPSQLLNGEREGTMGSNQPQADGGENLPAPELLELRLWEPQTSTALLALTPSHPHETRALGK